MLILSFEVDGVAVIYPPNHPPIKVMVTKIKGNQVMLGFDAPRTVKVLRDKLKPHNLPADARGGSANIQPTGPRPEGNLS
jgi:carbon storage regulator CsrA